MDVVEEYCIGLFDKFTLCGASWDFGVASWTCWRGLLDTGGIFCPGSAAGVKRGRGEAHLRAGGALDLGTLTLVHFKKLCCPTPVDPHELWHAPISGIGKSGPPCTPPGSCPATPPGPLFST